MATVSSFFFFSNHCTLNVSEFCQEKTRSSSQSRADPVGLSLWAPVLTSTGFQDDYVLVPQEGGGHREPSPSIQITPT